jgi:hypothetical protein
MPILSLQPLSASANFGLCSASCSGFNLGGRSLKFRDGIRRWLALLLHIHVADHTVFTALSQSMPDISLRESVQTALETPLD